MKKVFLALMAVAAIALTSCDKSSGEPGSSKDEKTYVYAYYMPQQVINCTLFSIDEGDGSGEHALEASRWTNFDKNSKTGVAVTTAIDAANLIVTLMGDTVTDKDVRQFVITDTKERTIKISIKAIDKTKIPAETFYAVKGTVKSVISNSGSNSVFADVNYTKFIYRPDDEEKNLRNIRNIAESICN